MQNNAASSIIVKSTIELGNRLLCAIRYNAKSITLLLGPKISSKILVTFIPLRTKQCTCLSHNSLPSSCVLIKLSVVILSYVPWVPQYNGQFQNFLVATATIKLPGSHVSARRSYVCAHVPTRQARWNTSLSGSWSISPSLSTRCTLVVNTLVVELFSYLPSVAAGLTNTPPLPDTRRQNTIGIGSPITAAFCLLSSGDCPLAAPSSATVVTNPLWYGNSANGSLI